MVRLYRRRGDVSGSRSLCCWMLKSDHSTLREELNLPRKAMATLQRFKCAQEKLRQDEIEAAAAARSAAQVLAKLGISRRDAGDLLGLSGARIQQVLNTIFSSAEGRT